MSNGKVVVEKIYDAKEGKNQAFKTLQLRSENPKKVTSSIVSNLLGGNFMEKRVAFQSIEKKRLETLGLAEGDDLSEKMGVDLRLTIREITKAQHDALPEKGDPNGFNKESFKAKETPDGDALFHNGEEIFRSTRLTSIDAVDTYLVNDPVGSEKNTIAANTEFSRQKANK